MRELKLEDLKKRGGGVGNCGSNKGGNTGGGGGGCGRPKHSHCGKCS